MAWRTGNALGAGGVPAHLYSGIRSLTLRGGTRPNSISTRKPHRQSTQMTDPIASLITFMSFSPVRSQYTQLRLHFICRYF